MAVQQAFLTSLLLISVTVSMSAASIPSEEGQDSLRGALDALDMRQRAIEQGLQLAHGQHANTYSSRYSVEKKDNELDSDSVDLISDDGQPEDIGYGYQRERYENKVSPEQLHQAMLDVLSEQDQDTEEKEEESEEKKRTPPAGSMFRERTQQNIRQHSKRSFASQSASTAADERKYRHLLAALWEKYQNEEQKVHAYEENRHDGYGDLDNNRGYDFYNSPLGWGASFYDGGNKRNVYNNYADAGYEMHNAPMGWGNGHFDGFYKKRSADSDPWYPAFDLEARDNRQLSVKKRSSNTAPLHQKTDEKIQAELAKIFQKGSKNSPSAQPVKSEATSTVTPVATTTSTVPQPHEKVIKKKSVDWSQYFGIDKRRKKSLDAPENEEERKMMERYYRTFALATTLKRKRSGGDLSPLDTQHYSSEQEKALDGMDQKLKVMEDLIVDEAVKFTGAHQGTGDTTQIKKVKDTVLERLAAAYSLEKMRQALVEFRSTMKGHSFNKRSIQ